MANFLIVRIENYKMNQAIGVDYEKDHSKEHGYNNPDWQPERIKANVILEHDSLKDGKTFPEYVKIYREENNLQGRMTTSGKEKSQTNVLTQCFISASPEYINSLNRGEQIKFFKDGLQAFKEMYPTYHIVDSIIHFDEKTPHMHINALPVYLNPEKNILQFSTTKTQEGRFHYKKFQDHMFDYMSRRWNIERGISHEERAHMNKKEWQQLKAKEQVINDREQQIIAREGILKQYEDRPLPHRGFLKKEKYNKEDVDRLVEERNTFYTKLQQKECETRQLENDLSFQKYKYQELDKDFTREHEEFLRLQDRQQDNEYLKQQLKEIENIHDMNHLHSHDRDINISVSGR